MAVVEGFQTRRGLAAAGAQAQAIVRSRLALPVLLYLLAVMLPIKFALGPIDMTSVRLVLIVMIVPLTVQLLMGRFGRIIVTDILFFLHLFWIVAALGINTPQMLVTTSGSTGVEFLGGYLLGRAYIRTSADFLALIKFLALITLCTMPFAIYEALTSKSLILQTLDALPGVRSLRDLMMGQRMGLYRVQLVFVHPIHYGLFCTMSLSLCFVGLKGVYSDLWRWIISVLVMICGALALSSGAFLAILLQLVLIGWAFLLRSVRWRWGILVGLIAFIYVTVDLLSNREPIQVFMSYATFSPHTAYWRSIIFDWGMVNVWANPIFGLGLNDWVRPRWMYSGSMDNFWLVMAVRYGIPGFGLLAAGYLIALWKIGRRDFESDPRLWLFRRAWMFSFVGLTFTLCTVHVWETIYSLVFFMFGAGMWMLSVQPQGEAAGPAALPAGPRGQADPPHRRSSAAERPVRASGRSNSPPALQDPAPADRSGPRYSRFAPRSTARAPDPSSPDPQGRGSGDDPALS